MTGPRFAISFCLLLIQRAATQCICQPDHYISIDDLLRSLGQGNGNKQSISIGQESCGYSQPSVSLSNQQSCGGSQPSFSLSNQQICGCSLQQPSLLAAGQPTIPLGSQLSGCGQPQQSISVANNPSASLGPQCGCGNQQYYSIQPSLSLNSLQSHQQPCCGGPQGIAINQPISNLQSQQISSGSQSCNQFAIQSQNVGHHGGNVAISNVNHGGSNVANTVPAALLQAPPYGIVFAGENLIIDGAVQVCGSMPFSSAVEVSGILPTSGSGCVQYVCNDIIC